MEVDTGQRNLVAGATKEPVTEGQESVVSGVRRPVSRDEA